jgi:hypothetical protein
MDADGTSRTPRQRIWVASAAFAVARFAAALAPAGARAQLDRALALDERKGNLVMVERTRSRPAELAELGP